MFLFNIQACCYCDAFLPLGGKGESDGHERRLHPVLPASRPQHIRPHAGGGWSQS